MIGLGRVRVGELLLKGGLDDRVQRVCVDLYPVEGGLSPKVVVHFGVSDGSGYVERPVSLRFERAEELLLFLELLYVGKVWLGRLAGVVRPDNWQWVLSKDVRVFQGCFRKV